MKQPDMPIRNAAFGHPTMSTKTTKPQRSPFVEVCKRKMDFLEGAYGFQIIKEDHKQSLIVYGNATTILSFSLDQREQMAHVSIGRASKIAPKGQNSWCYPLGDIVVSRAPEKEHLYIKHEFDWHKVLNQAARDLRLHATDVLLGDFAVFKAAQRRVEQRKRGYLEWLTTKRERRR